MRAHTLLFLVSSFICPSFCSNQFYADLQTVLDSYLYGESHFESNSLFLYLDPECVFNQTVLTSETIKLFPKCEQVFAIVVINEKTDLTSSQIKKYFKKMGQLIGGFRIENSNLTDLAFLAIPKEYTFTVWCKAYGVFIRNNSNLQSGFKLPGIFISGSEDGSMNCRFEVENNPKLNAEMMCDSPYYNTDTDVKVTGNLKNCEYYSEYDTPPHTSTDHTTLTQGLQLTGVNDTSYLSTVTQITGIIDIQNTRLQNLSFLKSVRFFKFPDTTDVVFNLKNNPEMGRLGFPNISNIGTNRGPDTNFLFNFENLHLEFCLTPAEIVDFFFQHDISFLNIHAKLCDETGQFLLDTPLCRFESMSKLPNNCMLILGDLIIEEGDEMDVVKLDSVWYLFGCLIIRNTKLETMNYLANLFHVAYFGPNPVIQIFSNPNLKEVQIPLKNVITRYNRDVLFQDNLPGIFNKTGGVCGFTDVFNNYLLNRTHFNYIGGDCEPECVFNQTVLTSETIKLFPKCEDVYGIIVINEKTDLTSSQIKKYFKKMEMLLGGFRIENSNLTDLAFLTEPKVYSFTVRCKAYGVFIRNNSNLKSEFKLPAIYILGNENGTMNCRFEVENNTKLNADMMCDPPYHNTDVDVKVTGNLKNCGESFVEQNSL
ncbi:hypothetical protein CRE_16006 [Caenorhabditis remanei]|uniref:Receptor L-domain domain-containing protein n=1 Tax=Caenorhabditis remanei TaxID=31234 RepID=E3MBB1_CAERE|nr:hypothetical protein CRE_16006 [Caenorhabditis remanei]